MKILGIETSCDETAAAVLEGRGERLAVLSSVVSSQASLHKKYGGVVPEVAAREHVVNMLPVIDQSLESSGFRGKPDVIAVTAGPGLITSLMSGIETAKTLSFAWEIPVVAVNHIEAHIYANFIEPKKPLSLPSVILTVSGGHTMLVLMKKHGEFRKLGDTRDDAAGEAFDKAAKLMGLGYPGGPSIAAEASRTELKKSAEKEISLPRPMINSSDFDFSFSGLKTALKYALEKDNKWPEKIPGYAREFQRAVVDVLVRKTIRAAKKYKVGTVMLAGGVAANQELRSRLLSEASENGFEFHMPGLEYTTDNAAMTAVAGYYMALRRDFIPWAELKADCNFRF